MSDRHTRHPCLAALLPVALLGLACDPVNNPPSDNGHGGNRQNHPPISRIVLPLTARVNDHVVVQNSATDPDGDAITAYRFRTPTQDFLQASPLATVTFSDTGQTAAYVSARDSRNAWSIESSATIRITPLPTEPRLLFADDGSLEPVDLGYAIGFPPSGITSLTMANGIRTITLRDGSGMFTYGRPTWFTVPRGAHIRFRARFTVEVDPLWEVASDDYGYSLIEFQFGHDGTSFGCNYFILARNDLLSEGFPGSPPKLEDYFQPGRHVFDRITNGAWIESDIDLDRLIRTRFNQNFITVNQFNQFVWGFQLRDVRSRGSEYRMKLELDYFEIYVPQAAQ